MLKSDKLLARLKPLNVILLILLVLVITSPKVLSRVKAQVSGHWRPSGKSATSAHGIVYPQFRSSSGVIHWLSEQMPLTVYVSRGVTLDKFIDDTTGAPVCNVNNLAKWPDLAASVLENPSELEKQPIADGFLEEHYQAAIQGINLWKAFEKEGLFSFQFTDDRLDADIYVFWVHHFVNNLGLGLFANDIRGYTAKRSFYLSDIQAGKRPPFKPVVIVLRTTDSVGRPMPVARMKASAAHEFGHALGIEGHSTNPADLMSIYYGDGSISRNDAATIRYLYHIVPELVP